MKEKSIELISSKLTFIIYVTIGVLGLFWDMGIFILLFRYLHINYLVANFSAMVLAICHNFLLNAYLNFKKTDNLAKRFVTFMSIGLVGIMVSETIMFIFHDKLDITAEFVKFGSLPFIAVAQYLLNKRFSFKKS